MIVDSDGGEWPVHVAILRLRFPIFRHIEEIGTVVLSEASPGEVELLLDLVEDAGGLYPLIVELLQPEADLGRYLYKCLHQIRRDSRPVLLI